MKNMLENVSKKKDSNMIGMEGDSIKELIKPQKLHHW